MLPAVLLGADWKGGTKMTCHLHLHPFFLFFLALFLVQANGGRVWLVCETPWCLIGCLSYPFVWRGGGGSFPQHSFRLMLSIGIVRVLVCMQRRKIDDLFPGCDVRQYRRILLYDHFAYLRR